MTVGHLRHHFTVDTLLELEPSGQLSFITIAVRLVWGAANAVTRLFHTLLTGK